MKRVKTGITTLGTLLTAACIYSTARNHSVNNFHSLDSHLSSKIHPYLEDEIAKYTPNHSNFKGEEYPNRHEYFQKMILCWLAEGSWSGQVPINVPNRFGKHRKASSYKQIGFSDPICSNLASDRHNSLILQEDLGVETLCPSIRLKKILFVGPETTFHLHENLLQALELHENRSHTCLGTEFCTFHQICRPPRSPDSSEPFFPPGGFKKYPSNRELAASQSGILKYILSNSLYTGSDMQDARYTDPSAQVDQDTGVRQKERYWLGQASKADVLVLNRGPIPAPAWTYDGTRQGNWSFAQKPGRSRSMRVDRDDREDDNKSRLYGERILDIALRVTVDKFLPEVVKTLEALFKDAQKHNQVVLWHGSWIIESGCAGKDAPLVNVLNSSLDPWTLFYNAQVHMQNYVLRALLPHFRVMFVPMLVPSRISNDGDLGYSQKSIMGRKDCLRYRFGSILEESTRGALLRGMSFAMQEIPVQR
ncbi:hypothetical protein F5890DRAFT_941565 [Lentinula detonsa]|uniref:Uncharacterized protein n=1 Tax=Lentinula detonsa TaxID=2804962 RepID=A0AA38UU87_9AGAR|nr:hypothetical protein F5890DRAFT_941565 [Lentinula detonsa]